MKDYSVLDWYWVVAGSTTEVFSSARAEYVVIADSTYVAWLAGGNLPTNINNDGELTDVLIKANAPSLVAAAAGQTDVSTLSDSEAILVKRAGGINLTSTATPALNALYSLDPSAISTIDGVYTGLKVGDGFPGGGGTFYHPDITGSPHAFISADFVNFALVVRDYLYSVTMAGQEHTEWPSNSVTIS